MTLALDTSALLGRFLSGPHRAGRRWTPWPPTRSGARRPWPWPRRSAWSTGCATSRPTRDRLRLALRDDWERIHVVPVDQRCLDRAAELTREQPLRTVDALHLAAADRLPARHVRHVRPAADPRRPRPRLRRRVQLTARAPRRDAGDGSSLTESPDTGTAKVVGLVAPAIVASANPITQNG